MKLSFDLVIDGITTTIKLCGTHQIYNNSFKVYNKLNVCIMIVDKSCIQNIIQTNN
jgi:hypothetical protein